MNRPFRLHVSTLRPLTACLALALGAEALAGSVGVDRPVLPPAAAKRNPDHPTAPQTWVVGNCSDGLAGSLREIILNPNKAQSGDTIDLSQLPVACNTSHAKITLSTGEVVIAQDSLTLKGPSPDQGTVTISGGGANRVLHHTGSATLSILNLTIADGYQHATGANADAAGGCIWSPAGNLYLGDTVVTGCTALSDTGNAGGGAILAPAQTVTLARSVISHSKALAPTTCGYGGGVFAGNLVANYSTISTNVAGDGTTLGGEGGGVFANGAVTMLGSTVDGNVASYGGGLWFDDDSKIVNSTISGNTAHKSIAALSSANADSVYLLNSTIAFNHADVVSPYNAVLLRGLSANSMMTLQSTIIADNTAGPANTPSDLSFYQGGVSGTGNLVMAASSSPPNVITVAEDPKLGPLQFNGGRTRTHALLPGSPAIGAGNHDGIPPGFVNDQRGPGYPRTTGAGANETTDIGAFEFDSIFAASFETF